VSDIVFEPGAAAPIKGNLPPQMKAAIEANRREMESRANGSKPSQPQTIAEMAETELVKNSKPEIKSIPAQQSTGKKPVMKHANKFFTDDWANVERQAAGQSAKLGSDRLEDLVARAKGATAVYERVELPSRGKFYDGSEGPENGILNVRCMTGREEQILLSPTLIKDGEGTNQVLKLCCRESIRPEMLLSEDRNYLLFAIRIITFGPEYKIEVKCPETGRKFSHTINLSENLEVNYCPDDFDLESLRDNLPVTGFPFSFRPMRGRDEVLMSRFREKPGKKIEESLTFQLALLIDNIEGLTKKDEIATLLNNLPMGDTVYLREVVLTMPFGINKKVQIYSPYSGTEFEVELPMEMSFFFPNRKTKKEEK
jgi:hypothetical protein